MTLGMAVFLLVLAGAGICTAGNCRSIFLSGCGPRICSVRGEALISEQSINLFTLTKDLYGILCTIVDFYAVKVYNHCICFWYSMNALFWTDEQTYE